MDPTERQAGIAHLFDLLAPVYDQSGVAFFRPIAARLLELAAPRHGEYALDVGCGRGAVTLPLAEAVGAGGQVVAVDVSPGMVEHVWAAAAEAGLSQLEARVGDTTQAGLETGSFDLVTASLVLFFAPDTEATLRHWLSLLRPTGRLAITTFGAQDEVWQSVDSMFRPYLPPGLLDPRTTGPDAPFASMTAFDTFVRASGGVTVSSVEEPVEITFTDAHQWRAWTMTQGQRGMWGSVPEQEREPLFGRMAAELEGARDGSGLIRLRQQVRYTTAAPA